MLGDGRDDGVDKTSLPHLTNSIGSNYESSKTAQHSVIHYY